MEELLEEYIQYQKEKMKKITYTNMLYTINRYIRTYFHNRDNLTTVDFYSNWKNYISNLSIATVTKNQIIQRMRDFLNFAVRKNKLSLEQFNNISFVLESIKDKYTIDEEVDNNDIDNFITEEELNILINSISQDTTFRKLDYHIFVIKFLFYTGLRKGELRGLKVDKINFEEKTIYINSQKLSKNYEDLNTTLKSKNSKRIILLDDKTLDMVKNWIEKNNLQPNDYLVEDSFTSTSLLIKKHINIVGKDNLTIHGLRHSHCSYLIQLYIQNNYIPDFGAIAKRLGHDVQNTMDVYYHMYPKQQETLINLINKG